MLEYLIHVISRAISWYASYPLEKYVCLAQFVIPPPPWRNISQRVRAFSLSRLHDHRHTTVGRTPLDEWSARRRDLYMTTHNTHNRLTSMLPAGFESSIPVSERPQTRRPPGSAHHTFRNWQPSRMHVRSEKVTVNQQMCFFSTRMHVYIPALFVQYRVIEKDGRDLKPL